MGGAPIEQLNEGIFALMKDLQGDTLAMKRVDIAVVTFGPVRVASDFHVVSQFYPPVFEAGGDTPMGAAILKALEILKARKAVYRANGISMYRPWIFMITDGAPTDAWAEAAAQVRLGEESKSFSFFAVGVENADMQTLRQISFRAPIKLKGLMFKELFLWLSGSMKSVSRSAPNSIVLLAPPTGWTEV